MHSPVPFIHSPPVVQQLLSAGCAATLERWLCSNSHNPSKLSPPDGAVMGANPGTYLASPMLSLPETLSCMFCGHTVLQTTACWCSATCLACFRLVTIRYVWYCARLHLHCALVSWLPPGPAQNALLLVPQCYDVRSAFSICYHTTAKHTTHVCNASTAAAL